MSQVEQVTIARRTGFCYGVREATFAFYFTRLGVPICATEQYPVGLGHTVAELAGFPHATADGVVWVVPRDDAQGSVFSRQGFLQDQLLQGQIRDGLA